MDVTASRKRRSRGAAYLAVGCSAAAFVVAAFGMERQQSSAASTDADAPAATTATTPTTSSWSDSFRDSGGDFTQDSRDFDNTPNADPGPQQWSTPQTPMGSSGGS